MSSGYAVFLSFQVEANIIIILICEYFISIIL